MSTVAIVGGGEIGGATARALAARDCVQRIVIIDAAAGVASGKALDIRQTGAIAAFHTAIEGTDDLSRVAGAAVCIIADRSGSGSLEWKGEEGLGTLRRVASFSGDAPILFAGTQQTELMAVAARELRIRRQRLIGSATEALLSAVKAMVAVEARCSPREVTLTVLGVPPSGVVIPWSEASIGGYGLQRVLQQVQLARIEARVARLWPPGPFALGAAAARVAESIVTSARSALALLTVLDGEFGVRNRIGTLPVLVTAGGIVHTRVPSLETRERVLVETALDR
jgi:malate dehydrogenase